MSREELFVFGLIGEMRAVSVGPDELAGILPEMGSMPGCLSWVVAADPPIRMWCG